MWKKHYGKGDGTGDRVLNPQTNIELEGGAIVEIEMVKIKVADGTKRDINVVLYSCVTISFPANHPESPRKIINPPNIIIGNDQLLNVS